MKQNKKCLPDLIIWSWIGSLENAKMKIKINFCLYRSNVSSIYI